MPRRAERQSPTGDGKSVVVTARIPQEIYNRAFAESQKRGSTIGREVERIVRAADDLTSIFSRHNLEKVQLYNRLFLNAQQLAEDSGNPAAFDVAFFDIMRRLLNERKGRTEAVMVDLERKMGGVFALVGSSEEQEEGRA